MAPRKLPLALPPLLPLLLLLLLLPLEWHAAAVPSLAPKPALARALALAQAQALHLLLQPVTWVLPQVPSQVLPRALLSRALEAYLLLLAARPEPSPVVRRQEVQGPTPHPHLHPQGRPQVHPPASCQK